MVPLCVLVGVQCLTVSTELGEKHTAEPETRLYALTLGSRQCS